jgi:ParB family chromosome partitioning protein
MSSSKSTMATIEVAKIKEWYNPRGEMPHAGLEDLAASIASKGVLEPLIVRKGRAAGDYLLVAGHRRLAAAKMAGKKDVPCTVVEATDDEASEIAIVENLHRADMHPLDEAEAYAKLAKTMPDIRALASRVGKPAAYVERRMKLRRLCPAAVKAYGEGRLADDKAEAVSSLATVEDQLKAVNHVEMNRWESAKDLLTWIDNELSGCLKKQPWVGNTEAMKAVGKCTKCPPTRDTLFGSATADECVCVACWKAKMKKYLAWMKDRRPGSVLITDGYSSKMGALASYKYDRVGTKPCKFAVDGIDVDTFKVSKVCCSEECRTHKGKGVNVPQTPAEKAKQEAKDALEKTKREAAEKKADAARLAALRKTSWPPSDKAMMTAIACLAESNGNFIDFLTRHGVDVSEDDDEDVAIDALAKKKSGKDLYLVLLDLAIATGFNDSENLKNV